jgi:hypothetical protein
MAIASITNWLNSPKRDFATGKMLYEQYGSDRLILTIIRTGSSTYHFQKLLQGMEALNKLSNLKPKAIHHEPAPVQEPPRLVVGELPPVEKRPEQWKDAPDPILEVRDEKNRRYAKARKLFEMIRVMDSQEHRMEAALELLDDMDYVAESWEIIDEWKKDGTVREMRKKAAEKEVAEMNLRELFAKSKNLASYISKDRARVKKVTDPRKLLKIRARLEENELKLEEMKRRIDELV